MPLLGLRRRAILIAVVCLWFLGHVATRYGANYSPTWLGDSSEAIAPVPSPSLTPTPYADPDAKHIYLPNGILKVNPNASHPILELIRDAEEKWEAKLSKASRTLDEAVAEYKRRYKRPPPKGFDDWWAYVEEHDVQLPDEYDFIHNDLEPFWGISPGDLQEIQEHLETISDSFTLGHNETHNTSVVNTAFSHPDWKSRNLLRGVDEMLHLLMPVEEKLPSFRLVFSPHDNPNQLSDYHIKQQFLDAARTGKYVNMRDLPTKVKHCGFASACPPGSPGRMTEGPVNQYERPPLSTDKSFIHDHQLSMNPCHNPSIFYHHGQYVAHDLGPRPKPNLAMKFSYCSTPLFHDLQPPTFINWVDDVKPRENDPPWDEKIDERLMWRGSNTGMNFNDGTRWIYAQRTRLARITNEMNGTEKVLFPVSSENIGALANDELKIGEGVDVRKSILNQMMDISFTGVPLGCEPEYCDYLKTLFQWRNPIRINAKEFGNHKYFVDVDGNGWSSRFKRLITSNSLVFKATAYPEWWLDRVQPWVHYVPIQVDYSDLYDAYIFFRGGLYGEGNHDQLAKKIALAGRDWSKRFWRREDMTAYFFRIILEITRLMHSDRDTMSYDP